MKIRKLILSAKLEQIEKQNQNIFIFHCSANAAQWRSLKNFLFFSGSLSIDSNENANPAGSSNPNVPDGPLRREKVRQEKYSPAAASELIHFRALESHPLFEPQVRERSARIATSTHRSAEPRLEESNSPLRALGRPDCFISSSLRGYTFFQSTSFKKRLALNPIDKSLRASSHLPQKDRQIDLRALDADAPLEYYMAPNISLEESAQPKKISRKRRPNDPLSPQVPNGPKSAKKNFRPKGCLFFFETRSHTVFETHQKSLTALELVNKIESLEFNNNLILLFGQLKSTVVNHVDLKEASILNTRATYQQFFFSMQSLSIDLSFCLHQKIDEFFCIQEMRKR